MKRILVYSNRKSDPIYWDASTPEALEKALWELFKELKSWNVYEDLEREGEQIQRLHKTQRELYLRANQGDAKALLNLLKYRKSYEYEEWNLADVRE